MLLSPQDAQLFFKLHRMLMFFVNERLQVFPNIAKPDDFSELTPEDGLKLRDALVQEMDLIEIFVDQNPFDLADDELDIVLSWRHQVAGDFYIFRYLKNYTVFLSCDKQLVAYGVLALAQPFQEMIGPYLPVWTKTVLMPFKGQIVYDGLLNSYNISFGPGLRRSMNEEFKNAKERLGIVTALPISQMPPALPKPKRTVKARHDPAAKEQTAEAADIVIGLVKQFCHEHLNDEYAVLCRKLAEMLARKRPSPLLRGKPGVWACGIVRTIGWVNFLHDASQQPHMKTAELHQAFGVSESAAQGKSTQIRRLFKIRMLDPDWTLPSRLDDNPLVWMLNVNGLLMDIRHAPREAQEVAFENGLIPYIPADRL